MISQYSIINIINDGSKLPVIGEITGTTVNPDELIYIIAHSCSVNNDEAIGDDVHNDSKQRTYLPSYLPEDIQVLQESDVSVSKVLKYVVLVIRERNGCWL